MTKFKPFAALCLSATLALTLGGIAPASANPGYYAPKSLEGARHDPLKGLRIDKRQIDCMAQALYHEARGETVLGQVAVAQVIINRAHARVYPDTICTVVYQNANRRNACQFSFACDGMSDRPREHAAWTKARTLAEAILCVRRCAEGTRALAQPLSRLTQAMEGATHYHATYVRPRWARHKRQVGQIGQHIFYRSDRVAASMPNA
jgi:N-acetylmuramoyl-L-alanine amidase